MMKKNILTILFIFSLSIVSYAQEKVNTASSFPQLFLNMPAEMTPLLTEVNRADMVDFIANDMKAVVNNRLGGDSELVKFSADYMLIKMTDSNTIEFKLLDYRGDRIVACIRTVRGPIADSTIQFYDLKWTELEGSKLFPTLSKDNFILTENVDKLSSKGKNQLKALDILFLVELSFSEKDNSVSATYNTPVYLEKKLLEDIESCITKNRTLQWSADLGYVMVD